MAYTLAEMEVKLLQDIVDKVPKTADGVSIVPGMRIYHLEGGIPEPLDVRDYQKVYPASVPIASYTITQHCYSTIEASETKNQSKRGLS